MYSIWLIPAVLAFTAALPVFGRLRSLQREASDAREVLRSAIEQAAVRTSGLSQQVEEAKGQIAYWKSKAEAWEAKFDTANADSIKARETIADWVSQRTFGRKIFEHAPALPERANLPHPVSKQRVQARAAVQMAERNFDKEYEEYMKKTKPS